MAIIPPSSWSPPSSTFIVISSARSGSTLLAMILRETGVYGYPQEYFNKPLMERWLDKHSVSVEECFAYAHAHGRSPDGTLGIKLTSGQLRLLHGSSDLEAWLPNRKWILPRRRDILGQAISREIALQTGRWSTFEQARNVREQPKYDFDSLLESLRLSLQENQYVSMFFSTRQEDVVEVVYEDFEKNYAHAIDVINDKFGSSVFLPDHYKAPIEKQRSRINHEWRERFLADIRKREASGRYETHASIKFAGSDGSVLDPLPSGAGAPIQNVLSGNKSENQSRHTDDEIIERHLEEVISGVKSLYSALVDDDFKADREFAFRLDTDNHSARGQSRRLHDPDFAVFKWFSTPGEVIIDAGANSGYSACSIRRSGSKADILSFEALQFHEAKLAEAKKYLSGRVDYRLTGLGKAEATKKFVVPAVNGRAITALATAADDISWLHFARNIIRFGDIDAFRNGLSVELDLAAVEARVRSLDEILQTDGDNRPVVAIKIDVEGLEPEVIEGALNIIRSNRPLLLIEGGRHKLEMVNQLMEMGYRFAARHGDKLEATEKPPDEINSFFWHLDQRKHYQKIGLMNGPQTTYKNRILKVFGRKQA